MSVRHSSIRASEIEFSYWLVFDNKGGVRLTRAEPGRLTRDERALQMTAKLPTALFETPVLRASLVVSNDAVRAPTVDIEATRDALRAVLGVDIDLTVTSQEQPQ